MFGGRYTWFPGLYKGGLRRLPLQVRHLPGQKGKVTVTKPTVPKRPVSPKVQCLTKPINWSQRLPTQEPPSFSSHTVFLEYRVHIPPATNEGGEIPIFVPAVWENPNAYQVPLGWHLEIKKLKIVLLDSSYDSLYVSILKNGNEAYHLEGSQRLGPVPSGIPGQPYFGGAGWMILPCWPQDQFNEELRYVQNERVGLRLVNNKFAEREAYVALWGWKYMDTCEYDFARSQ